MKARAIGTGNDIQEFFFRLATHMVSQSVCVMTIALHEEFGFGTERCSRLLERYKKINRHLNDYQDEAKSDAETRRMMADIGLQEFADAIMAVHDIKKYRQEVKQMNKVSIKEAAEARKNLEIMQALMKAKG